MGTTTHEVPARARCGLQAARADRQFEDRRFAYEATLALMRRTPDLAGIYVPGGGIEGVMEAMRERNQGTRVTVVAMDLFTDTRDGFFEGLIDVVLTTPVGTIADAVMAAMLGRLDKDGTAPQLAAVPFSILVSENL